MMIPLNVLLIVYLSILLLCLSIELTIEGLNKRHLKKYGDTVPAVFSAVIDEDEIKKTARYSAENMQLNRVHKLSGNILFILIILFGIIPRLAALLSTWHVYPAGLIFFGIIGLASLLFGLPFDFYHRFVLEDKYGFNTQTIGLWLMDWVKSVLLLFFFGTILITAILFLIQTSGKSWWFWAWFVFLSFQLLLTLIYPAFIAPLFNKFTPIEDIALKEKIEQLARNEAVELEAIMKMDASKRTRHTNAYLSGLGKAKRIVLFDSLLLSHSHDEILAVLSHEIGHLKKHHIKKRLVTVGIVTLALFYLASKIILWENLFTSFGFDFMTPYIGLFLVGIIWEPFGFFLAPLGNLFSRRFERQADDYALGAMKGGAALVLALKKMAKENLSNLYPHPAYVWFNYSHPPLLERIRHIENKDPLSTAARSV